MITKQLNRKILLIVLGGVMMFASCKSKGEKEVFEVKGSLTNNRAAMIYLEEIPVATMQRIVVDSATVSKSGTFDLKTTRKEACIYNLRLDQNVYPLTSFINDAPIITVNAVFNKENGQFAESYDVKGSLASQQMKDFMYKVTHELQDIYMISQQADSLIRQNHTNDSTLNGVLAQREEAVAQINQTFRKAISESANPALSMFELGYYQQIANNPAFKMDPLTDEEVSKIVNDVATRYPNHMGMQAFKASLDEKMQKETAWVGKTAPEIVMPDVNGKEIRLSSFRGKYVLVDFWASWCNPCRFENPNVVKAYNRFKDKNFTVLGVSLDRNKEEWIQAIMKDHLTWTHVSDLKEWYSPVVELYGFGNIGIPFNILVDPDGKVIGQGLRGNNLERKLTEVLK